MGNATLRDALLLLDGRWKSFSEGILAGGYSFWLGSGISRERFPSLHELLLKLLIKLFESRDTANPRCDCKRRLTEIMGMADSRGLDATVHPSLWDSTLRDAFLARLTEKYADVLDDKVDIGGHSQDIRWDVLRLPELYADPNVPPDAEHELLVLLIEEGIVPILVTTNWDRLVELAHENCHSGSHQCLRVVSCNDDLKVPHNGIAATLYKVHGCARRTLQDATKYRRYMIATAKEIGDWNENQFYAPFREAVRTVLRERPPVFIGLSIQDMNLQMQVKHAGMNRHPPPFDPPSIVFTVDPPLTEPQKRSLREVYGDTVYFNNRGLIEGVAALPLYAKPLLGTLYVQSIFRKATLLLQKGNADLDRSHSMLVEAFLSAVREVICQRYDSIPDHSRRWRQLAKEISQFQSSFLQIYRNQCVPAPSEYVPICRQSCGALADDGSAAQLNHHWLLMFLALLWEGAQRGHWQIDFKCIPDGKAGQFRVSTSGISRKAFIVAQGGFAVAHLAASGLVDLAAADEVLVFYPFGNEPKRRMTMPTRHLPGTIARGASEIWLHDLLLDSPVIDDLIQALRLLLV